jgi:hypothetical protein
MGDFKDRTSAYERVVQRGAEDWHRLAQEEAAGRRERIARNISVGRRRAARNGRPVTSVKVLPAVWRAALGAAGGDASRLRVVSATEVWVD